jgi:putative transcriptional regulator
MEKELFEELLGSAREAVAISKGELAPSRVFRVEPVDVVATREGLKMTQLEFAALIGVSQRTLQSWEQGRRAPSGAAAMLLRVASHRPQAILDTVRAG